MIAADDGRAGASRFFHGGDMVARVNFETIGVGGQIARGMQRLNDEDAVAAHPFQQAAAFPRCRAGRGRSDRRCEQRRQLNACRYHCRNWS